MSEQVDERLVTLDVDQPIWNRVFTVAPLVLVGTREESGEYDLAPKHMVTPIGLENYFGFVCTPRHSTYRNARREDVFTVSYVRPTQVVTASLAASGRADDDSKPIMQALATFPAETIDGVFVQDAYLFLECRLDRVIDDFGDNSLLIGRIVAAHVDEAALRTTDRDDNDLILENPLFAYLHPGRFADVDRSNSFPLPVDFHA